MKIFTAINQVMQEIGHVGKDRSTGQSHFSYKFRGIDDVYNHVNKLFAKNGIFTVPEVLDSSCEIKKTKSGEVFLRIIKVKYTFFAIDGSSVSCITLGEAMDSGDKATNKCMSAAHKYAILQMFCIPTEEQKDSENDTFELDQKATQKTQKVEESQELYNSKKQEHKNYLFKLFTKYQIPNDKMPILSGKAIDNKLLISELEPMILEVLG